ncbi:DUF4865 family protein [Mangrovitalea sediminis]|uniref:DUF4865 family protein n=1 Tax=Mangrovitalea sediminis TaxID=1982043 RepID=UPI0018E9ACEA|nr:DUF4865 family protein [Mangrovitalea sediminis]
MSQQPTINRSEQLLRGVTMQAMQYSFTLPADYDMSIISRRVNDKGSALDNHAPLIFKAYLSARRNSTETPSHENLYAPFYLWHDNDGMTDFLTGPGFEGLVNAFGWPAVNTWPGMIACKSGSGFKEARFASREVLHIPPFTTMENLRAEERRLVEKATDTQGALLALTAFEPSHWTLVRFRLWPEDTTLTNDPNIQLYDVLHVSHPAG